MEVEEEDGEDEASDVIDVREYAVSKSTSLIVLRWPTVSKFSSCNESMWDSIPADTWSQ